MTKVYRDCVYCGKVVRITSSLSRHNEDRNLSSNGLEVSSYFPYRSMLFTLDDQKRLEIYYMILKLIQF